MKRRLEIFISGFFLWVIYFLMARAFFMVYHFDATSKLSGWDIFLTFAHGARMDMAMSGYFSILPGLALGILFNVRGKRLWSSWFAYQVFLIGLCTFIVVLDAELYEHWEFRLDATPLLYLSKEMVASAEPYTFVGLSFLWILISVVLSYLLYRIFRSVFLRMDKSSWKSLPVLIIVTGMLFLPIRGSLGVAPMNTGFVYFHKSNIYANHAAINVVWNFGYALQKMDRLRYPEDFFPKDQTDFNFDKLFPSYESSPVFINQEKPNVIIIILESFTFRLIEPLGGIPDITPRINEIAKEGILFTNFYASGDRTDKGIVSILSGYPAQTRTSIIKEPKKTKSLPFLNQVFKQHGYRTEFTFGNNIDFANFNSYLVNAGFDHITHSLDFPQELNTGKWGVDDHYVFNRFFEETQNCVEPFFKVMMTLSSHEPFDVPMETKIEGEDVIHKFLNSAYYTDKSFGDFIDKARKSTWWKNTLIVVTADHGHPYPDNSGLSNPRRFKIPMIWIGGALNKKDTTINILGSHTDIANTILGQFGWHDNQFTFSHDILDSSYSPFAVLIYNNGFIFKTDSTASAFDTVTNSYLEEKSNNSDFEEKLGKAYMQKLYSDFNSR